jgi:hypothetical protein
MIVNEHFKNEKLFSLADFNVEIEHGKAGIKKIMELLLDHML